MAEQIRHPSSLYSTHSATSSVRVASASPRPSSPKPSVPRRCDGRRPLHPSSALMARFVRLGMTTTAPRLLPAARFLVHRGPGSPLRLALRHSAFLVPFLDVLGLPFLFVAVLALVAAWHDSPPRWCEGWLPNLIGRWSERVQCRCQLKRQAFRLWEFGDQINGRDAG